jgi:Protein of unknown function (DUF 659)
MQSVDATEKFKSAACICSLMSEVIEEVGASRVIQMVSDNGANFKAARKILLMEKYSIWYFNQPARHNL